MTNATAKTDRFPNRAPRGGAISTVNGRYYRGGTFMPTVAEAVEVKPATLEGSSRQIAWANRLRREALATLQGEIHARLMFLASPIKAEVVANRKALKGFLVTQHELMTERSAARVIQAQMAGR